MTFKNIIENHMKLSSENNNMDDLSIKFLSAAKALDPIALRRCIEDEVNIDVQDANNRNSALHYILSDAHFNKKYQEKAEECLEILLENGANPNLQNSAHKIPLELVVENMVPNSMAELLISHGASFVGPNGIQNTGLALKLVHRMPEMVHAAFDQAVKFTSEAPTERNGSVYGFWRAEPTTGRQSPVIELDWRYIVYNADKPKSKGECHRHETKFLHDVLSGGTVAQKTILPHPVVQAFLRLKQPLYWRHFGLYYFVWIILTFVMYLAFIWTLYSESCQYHKTNNEILTTTTPSSRVSFNSTRMSNDVGDFECESDTGLIVLAYAILFLYTLGPFWLELRRFLAIGPNLYAREWKNYVIIIATFIVAVTLWPSLSLKSSYTLSWQYPVAAVGMLVGSLVILIQLAPIYVSALFLEMVFKIFRRIVLATIVISPILLGFFFAFRILLTDEKIGPFKLLTMVISDNDYEEMMDSNRGVFYEIIAYAFFTAFIILVIIVVLNFLIGLAVSDIQELRESAKSANYISLVRSFYLMDTVYGNLWKYNSIIKNGLQMRFRFCPLDETDSRLPQRIKLELLEIARNRCLHGNAGEDDTKAINTELSTKNTRESTSIDMGS